MIRGRVQNGVVRLDESSSLPEGAEVHVELAQPAQCQAAMKLIDEWLDDRSGYDEETWPGLKAGLDEHRLSARRLFNGEADSA